MRSFILVLFILSSYCLTREIYKLPNEGIIDPDNNDTISSKVNYENFSGRVSDKDDSGRVLKIQVENKNTKFLKAGDLVYFKLNRSTKDNRCKGSVRDTEDKYFVIYVHSFYPCFDEAKYLKRGTILLFNSPVLSKRVLEGSKHREMLIVKRDDFLKQLNKTNHFLWTYSLQKLKTAADFDARIAELEKEKMRALDDMVEKKQEEQEIQNRLKIELSTIDDELRFYRVERQEYFMDRWHMDHDTGLPFGQRPQKRKRR